MQQKTGRRDSRQGKQGPDAELHNHVKLSIWLPSTPIPDLHHVALASVIYSCGIVLRRFVLALVDNRTASSLSLLFPSLPLILSLFYSRFTRVRNASYVLEG